MNSMHDKKGIDYAVLFLFVVLVCMAALFFQLQKKFEATGRALGEPQSSLLHLNYEREELGFFVNGAAKWALEKALQETKRTGGFLTEVQKIQRGAELTLANGGTESLAMDCVILNSPEKPRIIAKPDFLGKLTTEFNKAMDNYISQYNGVSKVKLPSQNYELYVEGNRVQGIALKPITIPIKRTYSPVVIGAASWKPSFEVQLESNPFDFYILALDYIESIAAECSYTTKPFECAQAKSPAEWKLATAKAYKDSVLFMIQDSCYALYLPPTTQPVEQTA